MRKLLIILLVVAGINTSAQSIKIVGDYTLELTAEILNADGSLFSKGTKMVFVSGKKVRVDYSSSQINQSTIVDNHQNTAVILREMSNNKFMSRLNAQEWKKQNARFEGMTLSFPSETKKILGYNCNKAVAKLKDGSVYTMFFIAGIDAASDENVYQFKDVPGLVLAYELQMENGDRTIRFTATNLSFDPVPASKFDIPVSGYRILENQK